DGQDCGAPGVDNVIQCQGVETWHHGDIQPQITTTWLGLVGPGVRNLGVNSTIWSDHTDTRPTIMALVGLRDDYRHDGRVLLDVLNPAAVPVDGEPGAEHPRPSAAAGVERLASSDRVGANAGPVPPSGRTA